MIPLEIQKFGGTSMADAKAMEQSGSVVINSRREGKAILVVTSAMSGVTDQLSLAVQSAVKGATNYPGVIRDIAQRTHELIDNAVEPNMTSSLHRRVDNQTAQAKEYVEAMVKLNHLSPLHFGWICAKLGEGFSAPTFSAHLQGAGIDVRYFDANTVLVTDNNTGNANPIIKSTRDKIKDNLVQDLAEGRVAVMGGYYGANRDGNLMILSRGGSDLSATAMGYVLTPWFDSISVYLYKADVAGVMSADPRIVSDAHVVPHMLYEEAAALTALGGKIIHPKAVHQAVRSGSSKRPPFPIYIKSTIDPQSAGTVIDNKEGPQDSPVKAISLIRDAVRLDVEGWGMDRPGIMSRITGVLASRGIDIDLIIQAYSKLALSLAFQYADEEIDLQKAIREALADEIRGNDVDMVKAMRVGVIGVIGKRLSDPRILGKVIVGMNGDFPELRQPDAYSLTTGQHEISILVDLPEERLKQLVGSIHNSVFGHYSANGM